MNRRMFLKSAAYAGAFVVGGPLVSNVLDFSYDIILPSWDGEITVTVSRKLGERQAAYAQLPGIGYAPYLALMPYQEVLARESALAAWQQQLIAYETQHEWIREREISAMRAVMAKYSNCELTQPRLWDAIPSIYWVTHRPAGTPVMFGINHAGEPVHICKTLPATAGVFSAVQDLFDKQRAERAAGPQSSELQATIILPQGDRFDGYAYKTIVGAVGITDRADFVDRKSGKVGHLVKYKTEKDGEKYMLV